MLRTLLLSLLCLLLLGPQAAFPVSSGQAPPMTEKGLPLNRTTFHFFSPEDIAANYRSPKIVRVGYFDQHGVFEGEGEQLSGYAVALLTAISRYTGWEYEWVKIRFDELAQRLDDGSIDLSCGISYTPERARLFDFSKLRAGTRTPACMSPARATCITWTWKPSTACASAFLPIPSSTR